jgi:hypothetical protein
MINNTLKILNRKFRNNILEPDGSDSISRPIVMFAYASDHSKVKRGALRGGSIISMKVYLKG